MKKFILFSLIIMLCLPLLVSCITTLGADDKFNEQKNETSVVDNGTASETETDVKNTDLAEKEAPTDEELKKRAEDLGVKIIGESENFFSYIEKSGDMELLVQISKDQFEAYLDKIANEQ
ncbi:MAG: hypothetical protein IJN75_06675 [Clostridia bacterium]|nr:hypothetical protein [Clostridia bacterium]